MLKPEDGYNEFDSTDESSEECTWFSCCDGPTLHPLSVVGVLQVFTSFKEYGRWNMNGVCALSLYICLSLCSSFFRILWMIMTTTRITETAFVMTLMTQNHHLNMNLLHLLMEVISSHNHNTGLFVVVGWLEFVVMGFIDVGELGLMAAELMVVVHMLFQQ